MSRQAYAEVWTYADPTTEFLKAAKNIEIKVFKAGTSELATIYEQREGGSQASNPFVSQENGLILFWANTGDYDIKFHDTKVPARFGDYIVGWQSAPVNVEIEAKELSNLGEFIEWSQESNGAWLPKIKAGAISVTQLKAALELPLSALSPSVQQSLFLAGDVKPTARSSAPSGWLLCNGASLLRTEYATLFAAIGTTYGAVDGTHFTVPDLQGRIPLGAGSGAALTARSLGSKLGEESHQLSNGEMPYHAHGAGSLYVPDDLRSGQTIGNNFNNYSGQNGFTAISTWVAQNIGIGGATAAEGGNVPHNNMGPSTVVNFLIKT